MEYYWKLVQFDGTEVQIPPAAVETVKRRWDNGEPIHLSTGSIPANQIKSFRQTDQPFNAQPLLEDVARAFNEPIESEAGIAVRWVKKNVTNDRWNKFYSVSPSYRQLGEFNGMTTVAFRVPVHQIDLTKVEECDEAEVTRLTNN